MRIRTKSGEERDLKKMRNCAVFLGEPAATELCFLLDALEAALSVSYEGSVREVRQAAGVIEEGA
jgi:hypothetical protein